MAEQPASAQGGKDPELPTCPWCGRYLHRHMDAYYYGFAATGETLIDNILCSVASAGKAYHHTEDWSGGGHTDKIQAAAEAAQKHIAALHARSRALAERCAGLEKSLGELTLRAGVATDVRSDYGLGVYRAQSNELALALQAARAALSAGGEI